MVRVDRHGLQGGTGPRAGDADGARPALSAKLREILKASAAIAPEHYDAARALAAEGRAGFADALGDFDVLLTPSALDGAPEGLGTTGEPMFNRVWTLLGIPCVTVPGRRACRSACKWSVVPVTTGVRWSPPRLHARYLPDRSPYRVDPGQGLPTLFGQRVRSRQVVASSLGGFVPPQPNQPAQAKSLGGLFAVRNSPSEGSNARFCSAGIWLVNGGGGVFDEARMDHRTGTYCNDRPDWSGGSAWQVERGIASGWQHGKGRTG